LQNIKKVIMQGRYKTPIPILISGCSSFRKRGHGKRFQARFEIKCFENGIEIKNGKIGHGSKKLEFKSSVAFGFKLGEHTFHRPLQAYPLLRRLIGLRREVMR